MNLAGLSSGLSLLSAGLRTSPSEERDTYATLNESDILHFEELLGSQACIQDDQKLAAFNT